MEQLVNTAWQTIRALPLPVQIVICVLFLPVMIGLWVWEASVWNGIVRLVLVVAPQAGTCSCSCRGPVR